ncbi:MAG: hypothetical protein GF308_20115 [Candidatus Heimdallarchaeota archaeon]|nr:hypothetical protein [Candidatus Heimdallarchaeota archaeon]
MDTRTIRTYLLHKQALIKKKSMAELSALVHQQLGLHSTDYLTPYISLWNRIQDFDPEEFFTSLNKLTYLRKRAYRGTVFIIDKNLFPIINSTSKSFAQSWFKGFKKELDKKNVDFNSLRNQVITLFKEHKSLTVRELKKHIASSEIIPSKWYSLLLRYYELDGTLVRTTHRYLEDKVIRYELVETIFPDIFNDPLDFNDAIDELFILYLKQYGPITIDDFSWWLPITKTKCKELIAKFEDDITKTTLNNQDHFFLKTDFQALKKFNCPDEPVINFLPYEDHFPKAYINREWYLAKKFQSDIIGQKTITRGQLWPSIWLNYTIIGKWEIIYQDKKKTSVKIKINNLFNNNFLRTSIRKEIEKQRTELEKFLNKELLPLNKN